MAMRKYLSKKFRKEGSPLKEQKEAPRITKDFQCNSGDRQANLKLRARAGLRTEAGERTLTVIPDLHGNALKHVYYLDREGHLNISDTDYPTLVDIYHKPVKEWVAADLETWRNIIKRSVQPGKNVGTVLKIGDELADRGVCDLLLLITEEELEEGAVLQSFSNVSNHALELIESRERGLSFSAGINLPSYFACSMHSMQTLIDKRVVSKEEVLRLFDRYKKKFLLVSCAYNGTEIVLGGHAIMGFGHLRLLAKKFGVTFKGKTKDQLRATINQMNLAFQEYVMAGLVHQLYAPGMIRASAAKDLQLSEESVFVDLVWRRSEVPEKELPTRLEDGTLVTLLTGHTPVPDTGYNRHRIGLDTNGNLLGKSPEHCQGAYSGVFTQKYTFDALKGEEAYVSRLKKEEKEKKEEKLETAAPLQRTWQGGERYVFSVTETNALRMTFETKEERNRFREALGQKMLEKEHLTGAQWEKYQSKATPFDDPDDENSLVFITYAAGDEKDEEHGLPLKNAEACTLFFSVLGLPSSVPRKIKSGQTFRGYGAPSYIFMTYDGSFKGKDQTGTIYIPPINPLYPGKEEAIDTPRGTKLIVEVGKQWSVELPSKNTVPLQTVLEGKEEKGKEVSLVQRDRWGDPVVEEKSQPQPKPKSVPSPAPSSLKPGKAKTLLEEKSVPKKEPTSFSYSLYFKIIVGLAVSLASILLLVLLPHLALLAKVSLSLFGVGGGLGLFSAGAIQYRRQQAQQAPPPRPAPL